MLTRKRTLWGGGALQIGDLCLVEDGGERNGTLVFDAVGSETASEGQDGKRDRVGVSMGADTKANTPGGGALERGQGTPREPFTQLGDALHGVGAAPAVLVQAAELGSFQAAKLRRRECQWR